MITIPHKNGIIADSDKDKIPTSFVAKVSDGVCWKFYETEEEYNDYKATLPVVDTSNDPVENPIIEALKDASPEEIAELKALLQ